MLRITKFIETHFWLFFIIGIVLGLATPQLGETFRPLLQPALMLMLLLIFLKLDLGEIIKKMKDFRLMSYLTILYLIIIPLFTYLIFTFIDKTLAMGFLLLAAMPPGVASPALTDIVKGNTVLAMSIMIICSLLAPFTVPLLFHYITPAEFSPNSQSMFLTMAMLIFIPLILSYPAKKIIPKTIKKTVPYFAATNVLIIFFFVYTAIATEQSFILANTDQVLWQLILLYLFFIALHIIGYIAGYGRPKQDKIAITVANTYRNNGMAIVLATSFFSPTIVILAVLSEIPWSTLLAPFKRSLKYLK